MQSSVDHVCRLAKNLARTCGWHVFPCRVADKKPCTPHGFKDASNDPARVTQLWRQSPGGLVGNATGELSGISVLDVDVKHDEARAWWRQYEHLMPTTRTFGRAEAAYTHISSMLPGCATSKANQRLESMCVAKAATLSVGGALAWNASNTNSCTLGHTG
jgi:hypothetical protein